VAAKAKLRSTTRGSEARRLQMMLKDTRTTLRSYYDAYHRLQGTQYSHGDCKC